MDVALSARLNRWLVLWIERHPLVTFIVLAYGVSWAALLLAHEIDLGAVNAFSVIMAAGPAFSGSIICGLVRPEPSRVPAGKRWRLFSVLAAMLLGLFALRRMWFALGVVSVVGRAQRPTPYPTWAALVADMLGAAVIALLLSGVDSSRQGYVRSCIHLTFGPDR